MQKMTLLTVLTRFRTNNLKGLGATLTLQNELNAFNDRIIELENDGYRGHAMEVLKAKAIDFARQIDELRCLLVVPLPKKAL